MKTIYSLKEFRQAIIDIAKRIQEDYVSVKVEVRGDGAVEFWAYINSSTWVSGLTMEDCISKMSDLILPTTQKNIDVELDIEQPKAKEEPIPALDTLADLPF